MTIDATPLDTVSNEDAMSTSNADVTVDPSSVGSA
jgi:hypothetical protein